MDDSILEPIKMYKGGLDLTHHENSAKYLDELVEKSGLNLEEHRKSVVEYKEAEKKVKEIDKKLKKAKTVKGLVVFVILVTFFVALASLYSVFGEGQAPLTGDKTVTMLLGFGCLAINIGLAVLTAVKINKWIKGIDEILKKLKAEAERLLNICWKQMNPLNNLFDWGMSQEIVMRTTPLIKLDKWLDSAKINYIREKYGFTGTWSDTNSTTMIQSGSIIGNPFLLVRKRNQRWVNHTYTGTLTVHWTTYERDSNGNVRTVNHSQTLVAHAVHPKPDYYSTTRLYYFNEAAPDLSFSRTESGCSGKSQKEIDKIVRKGEKELDKKAREAIKKGKTFTKMTNSEFEVLFGADDRDNEVQFRLLFTPLAQVNMVKLLKDSEPFGDDFHFTKDKCVNTIASDHSQNFNYKKNPKDYHYWDFDETKKRFMEYNDDYFKYLFFDFAPLLSIPLYQQHQTEEAIYGDPFNYGSYYSTYEHECVANECDINVLQHEESITESILKTTIVKKGNKGDTFKVTANGFAGIERVDYIPTRCNDGNIYDVPVHWIEYIHVEKDTIMEMKAYGKAMNEFNYEHGCGSFNNFISNNTLDESIYYKRGILSFIPKYVEGAGFEGLDEAMTRTYVAPAAPAAPANEAPAVEAPEVAESVAEDNTAE